MTADQSPSTGGRGSLERVSRVRNLTGGRILGTTEEWAQAHGVPLEETPPVIANDTEPCPRSAREIATRVVILQGVVAVACGVDSEPVVEWLREQGV